MLENKRYAGENLDGRTNSRYNFSLMQLKLNLKPIVSSSLKLKTEMLKPESRNHQHQTQNQNTEQCYIGGPSYVRVLFDHASDVRTTNIEFFLSRHPSHNHTTVSRSLSPSSKHPPFQHPTSVPRHPSTTNY